MKYFAYGLLSLGLLAFACRGTAPSRGHDVPVEAEMAPSSAQTTDVEQRDPALPTPLEHTRAAAPIEGTSSLGLPGSTALDVGAEVTVQVTLKLPTWPMLLGRKGKANLEGVACSVEAQLPDGTFVKRSLHSDKFRRAITTIPREAVRIGPDRTTSNVIARLIEPGYQERFALARARTVDGVLQLSVGLVGVEGVTARGVVVSHLSGTPVPIDSLEMFGPGVSRRSTHGRGNKDWIQWTQDGRFEVHVAESRALDMLARSFGHGSGSLSQVSLSLAQPPQNLRIEVGGPARVVGRLVQSDGSPPLPTKLRAISTLIRGEKWSPFGRSASTLEAREGSGLLDATVWSRADGTFEFTGLRLGEYSVLATVPPLDDPGYLTVGKTIAAPVPEPMIAVFDVSHLVVSLEDVAGRPWGPKLGHDAAVPTKRVLGETAWPTEPRVVVRDAGPIGALPMVRDPIDVAYSAPDEALSQPHRRVYRLHEGRQYLVSVVGGDFISAVQHVAVPQRAGQILTRFQAGPAVELGVLELSGTGIQGRGFDWGHRADVLAADDPASVILSNYLGGHGPYRLHLPTGDYDVRISGVPFRSSHGTWAPPNSSYFTRRVHIDEGQTTREAFALHGGGTLEVSVDCETPYVAPPIRDGLYQSTWPMTLLSREVDAVESPRCVATLTLLHPSGDVEAVRRSTTMTGIAGFPCLVDTFPSGRTWTSNSVSTGNLTLYARLRDGRERQVPVTITEGAATAVSVSFD